MAADALATTTTSTMTLNDMHTQQSHTKMIHTPTGSKDAAPGSQTSMKTGSDADTDKRGHLRGCLGLLHSPADFAAAELSAVARTAAPLCFCLVPLPAAVADHSPSLLASSLVFDCCPAVAEER